MNLEELKKDYDKLQLKFGSKELDSIYNGGCEENPEICFVFMNPTKRNIASSKSWNGLKAPWIGTKNIWGLFYKLGLLDEDIYNKIKSIKGSEWTEEFANEVYNNVKKYKYFITNLGKCTQDDARELPNNIYEEYLSLLEKEIEIINPKVVILFGNQVSSIVLNEKVSVSQCRKKVFQKEINGKKYNCYSVFYPVGNGRFNMDKSIEDILYIMKKDKMKKIVFATGNPSKAKRFSKGLLKQNIEVISLKDLDLTLDVEENGKNAIENALIKARECYKKTKMPSMGMDDTLYLENVPEEAQPGLFVRRVNGKTLNDEEMLEHYTKLIKKYGKNGRVDCKWVYGLAIINEKGEEKTYTWCKDNFYMVDTISDKINPGYPLNSISKYKVNNKYFTDVTEEDKKIINVNEDDVVDFIAKGMK